jgi:hypothetical protein
MIIGYIIILSGTKIIDNSSFIVLIMLCIHISDDERPLYHPYLLARRASRIARLDRSLRSLQCVSPREIPRRGSDQVSTQLARICNTSCTSARALNLGIDLLLGQYPVTGPCIKKKITAHLRDPR